MYQVLYYMVKKEDNFYTFQADVTDENQLKKVLLKYKDELPKISGLVCSAGKAPIPKKIEDKLVLKFKSKSLHDHFQAEWQIDLVREAVRKSVTEIYGEGIKLVLEEPDEEQKNNIKTNLLENEIVKSALAMGAKVEEEKEG